MHSFNKTLQTQTVTSLPPKHGRQPATVQVESATFSIN